MINCPGGRAGLDGHADTLDNPALPAQSPLGPAPRAGWLFPLRAQWVLPGGVSGSILGLR